MCGEEGWGDVALSGQSVLSLEDADGGERVYGHWEGVLKRATKCGLMCVYQALSECERIVQSIDRKVILLYI